MGNDERAELYRERVVSDNLDMNEIDFNATFPHNYIAVNDVDSGNDWMCNQCDHDFGTYVLKDALALAKEHFKEVYIVE